MTDTEPVRGIAEAHRRVDAVVERVIRLEAQNEEIVRRLSVLETVPKDLNDIKVSLADLSSQVKGSRDRFNWLEKGLWLLIGAIVSGGVGLLYQGVLK